MNVREFFSQSWVQLIIAATLVGGVVRAAREGEIYAFQTTIVRSKHPISFWLAVVVVAGSAVFIGINAVSQWPALR